MTKLRIARVALAYVSRSGSVTLVSVNLERCGTVLAAAALSPLKRGDGGVRYVFNTATRVGINARIRIEAFDALGVDTSSEAVGDPLPSWLVLVLVLVQADALAQARRHATACAHGVTAGKTRQGRR